MPCVQGYLRMFDSTIQIVAMVTVVSDTSYKQRKENIYFLIYRSEAKQTILRTLHILNAWVL